MMSARPPPPPIFPRDASISTVAEPPRPLHATTFSSNQLPPPVQSGGGYAPRSYSGRSYAPISITTNSPGGGSPMQQQHPSAPHQHIPPTQHSPAPYPPPSQSDGNFRRVSMGSYLSERPPAFSSPASSSTYSSPASFAYDQRIEHASSRRYSHEASPENRRRV